VASLNDARAAMMRAAAADPACMAAAVGYSAGGGGGDDTAAGEAEAPGPELAEMRARLGLGQNTPIAALRFHARNYDGCARRIKGGDPNEAVPRPGDGVAELAAA
jgi:hypothetical protein